jgi:hypothetical protein
MSGAAPSMLRVGNVVDGVSRSPCQEGSMDIGEERRTIYIEPIEEPAPVQAPEPSEPVPDPRKDLEPEPA